jgi:hypothetical protein
VILLTAPVTKASMTASFHRVLIMTTWPSDFTWLWVTSPLTLLLVLDMVRVDVEWNGASIFVVQNPKPTKTLQKPIHVALHNVAMKSPYSILLLLHSGCGILQTIHCLHR